ncbi:hypothetical protein RJ640_015388 [Escallonia rubra]|uniref:Malectin-like domain-containing protein n=1 Tax=Escallonia rubra TaxID=112253 RepID=A0AA88RE36_9ASTE|nr:hypothetical protein RJ640_015388 [Escallonia rubra]
MALSKIMICVTGQRYSDLLINCGASNRSNVMYDYPKEWQTDEQFIKTGENRLLSSNSTPIQMDTLRYFGNATSYRFMIMTNMRSTSFELGLYYGKQLRWPLQIDGNLWAHVATSMSKEPVFHELLYVIKAKQLWCDLLCFLNSTSQLDTSQWVGIDCGSAISIPTADRLWQTDDNFVKTGTNKLVSPDSYNTLEVLNSLRVFTQQNKNCYTVPANEMTRYFVRASFHYGNYDLLKKAPTFDLQIDGNKWMTVVSNLSAPVYYEIIYTSKGDNISVCLARTQANQFPFISSLEVWPIPTNIYTRMSQTLAWLKSYRLNYGANDLILGYSDGDRYNRIWEPATPSGLVQRITDTRAIFFTPYEDPPYSAIWYAVEANSSANSILLSFKIGKTNSLNYIEAYFTEIRELETNETRQFGVYVNNGFAISGSPEYQNCTGVVITASQAGTLTTVELRPTPDSTLPPIISAIEVYTASDPLVTTGTSQDDISGLAVFISTFAELDGWSGEPCLPSYTVWQWLGCSAGDPVRVLSFNLSNNRLNGEIPEFLGNLPNLKLLVKANPGVDQPNGKRTGVIIALAIGVPIASIQVVIVAVVCFVRRKRRLAAGQGHNVAASEAGSGPQLENSNAHGESGGSTSMTMVPLIVPSHPNGELHDNMPDQGGNHTNQHPVQANNQDELISCAEAEVPVTVNAGDAGYQSSMVPDMDMEELDELLQQHEHAGASGAHTTDEKFTKAGINKLVSTDNFNSLGVLNSLRAFTQQNKNCYNLPTTASSRYFLRAAFYYGNYDGLSNPPTFDLEIDENKWTTVVSSLVAPVYYEVIYASKGDNIFVCLAQTVANQFPFISSLEAWPITDTMYNHMDRNLAWLNSYRYNYGTKDLILGYPEDSYNRIWIPAIPSGMVAKIANTTTLSHTTDEQPPDTVILDAIEAPGPIDSISLLFNMSKNNSLYYIEAYFTGMEIDDTRSFDIYVNNNYLITRSPEFENCTGAWTTTNNHTGTLTTVELRPTAESTLPPIISAIEVYTASDPLVTTGTSQDDLDGLAAFVSKFEQLQGWSGEPCLPTRWQWLGCNSGGPLRVNSIYLSGYGLEGPLPDFRQMTGLETIDLSNNRLNGDIPDFLGSLPNLKQLVTGNPHLGHHKKENKALTSVVAVILVVVAVDTSQWLAIDCGSITSTTENDIDWQTDDRFINTGSNKQLHYSSFKILDSFRLFTEQNKNCYTLPVSQPSRYFIRAAFNYGNYDKLSKPPTFDLEIDGNKWTTVVTSLTKIKFYEVIYTSRGDNVSVCLARTKANQFPFISSLEAWPIPDTMYTQMSRNLAWLNSYRYNYGTNDPNDVILGYPTDSYNRIWEPAIPPETVARIADTTVLHNTTAEHPPHSAIFDAIESSSSTNSISLSFKIGKANSLNYIETYFTELTALSINDTRSFDMYVDGNYKVTISPEYQNCTGAWAIINKVGTLITAELRPTSESTLPPIISAIELYTASDALITTGTSQDDLNGLAAFTSTFEQLNGWSGEPCLPSDTVWQWLGCTANDPIRVISMYDWNPNVDDQRGSKSDTIVGMAVGIPLAFILILVTDHVEPNILATENGEGTSFHTSMVPDMDMDELDELLEQHERARG